MGEFKRGQIFKVNLPGTKFESKIQPPTPLVSGEHFVVVLHDSENVNYNNRQVLVAPILTEEEIITSGQSILITHIAVNKSHCESIIEDSMVCTHQIIPINRQWLPEQFSGDISGTDLSYKIDLGIISAAGLMNLIENYVEESANQLKIKYTKPIDTKLAPVLSSRHFKRGDVFFSQMPETILNTGTLPPTFTIYGEHRVVVLHDSDDSRYDASQVLVAPITSAAATVREGKLLPTHIDLLPSEFTFIKKTCYVSTHQMMPINRDWMDNVPKGNINSKMLEVDLGIVLANDLTNTLNEFVAQRIKDLTEEALKKLQQESDKKEA